MTNLKIFLATTAILSTAVFCEPLRAETGTCGQNGTATCRWTTVDLPDGGKQVIISRDGTGTVGLDAGESHPWGNDITAIVIQEGISSIREFTFNVQRGVTSIDMSRATDLTSIGRAAFANIGTLKDIVIPENVTYINNQVNNDILIRSGVQKIYCTAAQLAPNGACSTFVALGYAQPLQYEKQGNLYAFYYDEGNNTGLWSYDHTEKYDNSGNIIRKYDKNGNLLQRYGYTSNGSFLTYDADNNLIGVKGKHISPAEAAAVAKDGNNNTVSITW